MAFKPNYGQQRAERKRSKDQKREEKLRRREEKSAKRKSADEPQSPAGDPEHLSPTSMENTHGSQEKADG
jgi:hypothetical protein